MVLPTYFLPTWRTLLYCRSSSIYKYFNWAASENSSDCLLILTLFARHKGVWRKMATKVTQYISKPCNKLSLLDIFYFKKKSSTLRFKDGTHQQISTDFEFLFTNANDHAWNKFFMKFQSKLCIYKVFHNNRPKTKSHGDFVGLWTAHQIQSIW